MDALWNWCRRSATIVWARLWAIIGIGLEAFAQVADFVTPLLPQITPFVPPRWLGLLTLFIAIGSEIARRRTL